MSDTTGVISGTPYISSSPVWSGTITVTDSAATPATATGSFSITTTSTTALTSYTPPSGCHLNPSSNSLGSGQAFITILCPQSQVIPDSASGIVPVYSGGAITAWSVGGSLPTGMSIDVSTGVIYGTPSATGSYSATVHATTSSGTIFLVVNMLIGNATTLEVSSSTNAIVSLEVGVARRHRLQGFGARGNIAL